MTQHHLEFLETCLQRDVIPKGLQLQFKPQIYLAHKTDVLTMISDFELL